MAKTRRTVAGGRVAVLLLSGLLLLVQSEFCYGQPSCCSSASDCPNILLVLILGSANACYSCACVKANDPQANCSGCAVGICDDSITSQYPAECQCSNFGSGDCSTPLNVTCSLNSTYGDLPQEPLPPQYDGFVPGDGADNVTWQGGSSPRCNTSVTATSPPGLYNCTCSGPAAATGSANVSYAVNYLDTPLTVLVEPAILTITASSEIAVVNGSVATVVAIYSGLKNGNSAVTALTSLPDCTTTATSTSAPGTYATYCYGAVSGGDYAIQYVNGTCQVVTSVLLTITASSASFVYGSIPSVLPAVAAIYSGLGKGETIAGTLSALPQCTTTMTPASHGGSYASYCTGAVIADDYIIRYVNSTYRVTAVPLLVTASSVVVEESPRGQPPIIVPLYEGFVNGDTNTSLVTVPGSRPPICVTDDRVPQYPGFYSSVCRDGQSPDYVFIYLAGEVLVTPLSMISSSSFPLAAVIAASVVTGCVGTAVAVALLVTCLQKTGRLSSPIS
jgi:hypothetical protein